MAGLPESSACVCVGPPLSCRGPRLGFPSIGALPLTVQSAIVIKLLPIELMIPSHSPAVATKMVLMGGGAGMPTVSRFPAIMVFWKLNLAPEALKTPPPVPLLLEVVPGLVIGNRAVRYIRDAAIVDATTIDGEPIAAHRAVD